MQVDNCGISDHVLELESGSCFGESLGMLWLTQFSEEKRLGSKKVKRASCLKEEDREEEIISTIWG